MSRKDPSPSTPLLPNGNQPTRPRGLFSKMYYSIYDSGFLNFYDLFILGFSCTTAWRCPTSTYLLPLFRSHMTKNHLDVGVGTGFFPSTSLAQIEDALLSPSSGGNTLDFHSSHLQRDALQKVTIWDLSKEALSKTKKRIEAAVPGAQVRVIEADALKEPADGKLVDLKFDSISAFHLLHCIPYEAPEKTAGLFSTLRNHLSDDGVLIGCTVLGDVQRKASKPAGAISWVQGEGASAEVDGAKREERQVAKRFNPVGWFLMWMYNRSGIFTNWKDNPDAFAGALEREFEEVETWIVGRVLIFRAKKPRKD